MKKHILFSLVLTLMFFSPSYAEEVFPISPTSLSELENLHNLPANPEVNPEIRKMVEALEEEKKAFFANAPAAEDTEDSSAIENLDTTDGLETISE